MDLKITPGDQRKWAGVSGHNVPSFEVFISPDWRGTEGVYFANLPSFRSSNYVEEFESLLHEEGPSGSRQSREKPLQRSSWPWTRARVQLGNSH